MMQISSYLITNLLEISNASLLNLHESHIYIRNKEETKPILAFDRNI